MKEGTVIDHCTATTALYSLKHWMNQLLLVYIFKFYFDKNLHIFIVYMF